MSTHRAERSCKGCGKKQYKVLLYRLVLDEQKRPMVDRMQCAQGRGAYVCKVACLRAAVKRKALQRAFRAPVVLDALRELEAVLQLRT